MQTEPDPGVGAPDNGPQQIDVWANFKSAQSFALTLALLKDPADHIVRVLEHVSVDGPTIERRLTFEYDSPGVAHFFPALIAPSRTLLDTFHVEQEINVQPLTLTKPESEVLSFSLLDFAVRSVDPDRSEQPEVGQPVRSYRSPSELGPDTTDFDIDGEILPKIPEIALPGDSGPVFVYLKVLRNLWATYPDAQLARTRTAAMCTDNSTWRLLQTFRANRVVYVPVAANRDPRTGQLAPVRQKVTISYERDPSSSLAAWRSRFRVATGHDADDYLIQTHAFDRGASYHFRMRGKPDSFVTDAQLVTPKTSYARDDWERPRVRDLRPLADAEAGEVRKPDSVVDTLVHIYVRPVSGAPSAADELRRHFVRARFRPRPMGHLGVTLARVLVALLITSFIGIYAHSIVPYARMATVPITILFAVPSLIGLTQGFRASSYVMCNLATYGSILLSIACGGLYLHWALMENMPDGWGGTRGLYLGLVIALGASFIWLLGLLLATYAVYTSRRPGL